MEIVAPSPSASEAKNFSKRAGSIPLLMEPSSSPFGPVSLRARIAVQAPVTRLYTGSTRRDGEFGSDLKVLNQARSTTLTGGIGHTLDELISAPSESNRLTAPT